MLQVQVLDQLYINADHAHRLAAGDVQPRHIALARVHLDLC
jgi:hypothetical protein